MEPWVKGGCRDSRLTLMCNEGESPSRTCGGPHRQVFQPLSLVLTFLKVERRQHSSKITSHRTHKSETNPSLHQSYLSLLGFSHNMLRTPLGHHFSSQMPPRSHQLVMISGQMQTIKWGRKESTFHYQSPKWLTPWSNCLLSSPRQPWLIRQTPPKSQNSNPEGKEPGENWNAQLILVSAWRTADPPARKWPSTSRTHLPSPPLLLPSYSLSPKNSRQLQPDFWWIGHCVLFDNVYHSANMNLQDGKNITPRKDYVKGKKIIRQLRMAIIHPYLCFGKKYCPRELALLITLSSVWGLSERRFCVRCWWFPAVFLSVIKTNARLLIEPSLSWGSPNLYIWSWATKLTKHVNFLRHLHTNPFQRNHLTIRIFDPKMTLEVIHQPHQFTDEDYRGSESESNFSEVTQLIETIIH